MKIQPHETKFIDLPDPKAILERELTNYSCVFKGDTINI
jgi:ubiquitin fusion degradation protein 1